MAGLTPATPIPVDIKLHQASRLMEVIFSDGARFELPYELLRVSTPSAEARGHGPGQHVLQTGKRDVGIAEIEMVGNYAIRPIFTDGHGSGIYSWDLLYDLGRRKEEIWRDYLTQLENAGASRDVETQSAPHLACGKH